jgi:hypothetical protein
MGTPAINLSAGMVPAAPPPPPAGGINLAAGMVPTAATPPATPNPLTANPTGEGTYGMRGTGGDTLSVPFSRAQDAIGRGYTFSDEPTSMRYQSDLRGGYAKGAVKSLAQVPNTLAGWLDRVSDRADQVLDTADTKISGTPAGPQSPSHMKQSLEGAEEKILPGVTQPLQEGPEQHGAIIEQLGEWMAGEGMLKQGLSLAQRTQEISRMMGVIEKYPALAKTISFALRHGAVAAGTAGQATLHGATVGEAGEAAALSGGASAGLDLLGAGGKAALARLAKPATTTEAVANAAKDVVAERVAQTNAATRGAQPTTAHPEGNYKFKISGTPTVDTTEGSIAQQPRKAQTGTRAVSGKGPSERQTYNEPGTGEPKTIDIHRGDTNAPGSHKAPTYALSEESRPGTITRADSAAGGGTLITEDPKIAAAHLGSLDDIISGKDFAAMPEERQSALLAQRDDMQRQISGYYAHQRATGAYAPAFPPIDAKKAVDATGNFNDARDVLHSFGKEVYEHANNVTGGRWQTLDQHIDDLYSQLGKHPADLPSEAAARRGVQGKIAEAQSAMLDILEDPKNGFTNQDISQAKKNFRAGYVLQDAHEAIKPIYAIEQQPGRITGRYRGFNGQQLGAQWKDFLDKNPDAKQILGGDRVDTLTRLFKENETMAARKRFGDAVFAIAGAATGFHFGGLAGAGEGAIGGPAIRYVLDGLISNPKVAKSLMFAIDSGAAAKNYAPGLAKMIEAAKAAGRATIPVTAEHLAKDDTEEE